MAVQKGISGFVKGGGIASMGNKSIFKTSGTDSVDLLVFRNIRITIKLIYFLFYFYFFDTMKSL